jgi:lipopolysaccharide/colanic/teichoic acid biosynthesis glycosyltransferase
MERVLDYINQMTIDDKVQLLGMLKTEMSVNGTIPYIMQNLTQAIN